MRFCVRVIVSILSVLTLVPTTDVSADLPATCPVEVARWEHGPSLTVSASGSLGLFGSGAVLRVVDFSESSAPVVVGEIALPDVVYGAEMDNRYAYVAAGAAGLWVIDLIDPSNPVAVGSAPYGSQSSHLAKDVVIDADIAFVLGRAGFVLYDISQPLEPSVLSTFSDESYEAKSISIQGTIFVGTFDDVIDAPLYFVDFINPNALQVLSAFDLVTGGQHYMPTAVIWSGDLVYVSEYNSVMFVIDASNPASPQLAPVVVFGGGRGETLEIVDTVLLMADRFGTLTVFDISNPNQPTSLAWVDGLAPSDLWPMATSILVSSHGGGFNVIELSDPSTPTIAGEVIGIGAIEDLVMTGNTGFIQSSKAGLVIVDLPKADSVEVLDVVKHGYPKGFDVSGQTGFFMDGNQLRVLDVADPHNVSMIGSCPINYTEGLAVSGSVGVSPSGSEAETIDLSNPFAPAVVGSFTASSGSAGFVETAGNFAYVTFGHLGSDDLVTCDVSNPAAPFVTSEIDITDDATDLLVVRDHLIEATKTGIKTFDLTDPTLPVSDGWLSIAGDPDRIDALANLLFVTDTSGHGALHVIDISDPSSLSLACSVPTAESPTAVSVTGGRIYVGFANTGLQVFEIPGVIFADGFERGDDRHWN